MTPTVQALFREVYAKDPEEAGRLATADAMIRGLMEDSDADAEALTNAFMTFSPNLMPLLDSPEGVAVLATAMAALTGISTTFAPTSH